MAQGRTAALRFASFVGLGLMVGGCSGSDPVDPGGIQFPWDLAECAFDPVFIADGGTGIDGIPAISDPVMVNTEEQNEIGYVADDHRVVGIVVAGQPLAFPLSALWYHEIVNLNTGGAELVVTHGTLSGTSRVFRRSAPGGNDFGVSGLLYQNNLLLYDRATSPSLWAQITGEAGCGPLSGTSLSAYPFVETTWAGWKTLHPSTLVLSSLSASAPVWGQYPYGTYETSPDFFFASAMPPLDRRLHPKERVLGIEEGVLGGIAFPFGSLVLAGSVTVAHGTVNGKRLVVFWRTDLGGAAAYWAEAGGQPLTFTVQDAMVLDQETGTTWDFLGVGSGGGLDGAQLQPVSEATVAYWGVWAAFNPETEIWEPGTEE